VIADLDTYDASPRALCNATGAVVVSTHYRQAPEHKFPAAHEDVFGVYQWLVQNPAKLKIDSKKIAVVGESAGGNMAAAISLMAKDKGIQMPVHQVLVYPVADMTGTPTPSLEENAMAKPLNKAMLEWFGKHLLAKPEDAKNPGLSLLLAGDKLKGLPSTTIILAQIDPLRSGGEALGKALQDAGVKVNLKIYEGVTHEFFGMGAVVDKAKDAVGVAAADLKAAFGK
jgi:acetyl esterase/lipase